MRERCTLLCLTVVLIFPGRAAFPAQSREPAPDAPSTAAKPQLPNPPSAPRTTTSPAEISVTHVPPPATALPIQQPSHPASLFDAITPVTTTVEVRAATVQLDTSSPPPLTAGGEDVINSAGTFGDISRYLQLLPGVVASSDYSNQMLVRGGHPMENLFLVDGIEVPNINHLANANTSGGFGPMIDAAVIQGLSLYTGGFDAKYSERLSSVTEFRTLDSSASSLHAELDFGVQGLGGLAERRLRGGDLLISAHHGLINLFSEDVGMNGVPSYTNELTRYRRIAATGDRFTILHVAGWDSISIVPCASDVFETSTIDSDYSGWRETTGAEWQHVRSPRSFDVVAVSDSEQLERIRQDDQMPNALLANVSDTHCPDARNLRTIPVYHENSNSAFSTATYRYEWASSRFAVTAGSSVWLQRPHFQIAQPQGTFSPYSDRPIRADSNSIDRSFSTGETGTYTQVVLHPVKQLSVSGGGRLQSFAFGNQATLTPRINAAYRFGEKGAVHIAYAGYAQLPPYAYMLAYPVNRWMSAMRATHEIVGLDLGAIPASQIRLEAYKKDYHHIPASTEYAAVTMHTLVDMIGEQSVWLPMTSVGHGTASGIELSDSSRLGSRIQVQGSVAYARAKFAGTDGVLRPSNFDFPWIVNAAGVARIGHGMIGSARYGFATGRPYTPFDLGQSTTQNRPVYDLTRVNGPRTPYYSRLDFQVNKEMLVRNLHLELYAGVDNVLNRSNFLSYAWMPRSQVGEAREPVGTLWQTPIFPNFGLRLIVK